MTDAASASQTTPPQNGRDKTANQGGQMAGLVSQLRSNPRIPLLIAGAAAIAIIAALLLWARTPDYRVLYSNLSNADGGRIVNELDTRGIPYRFTEGGGALLVPGDQVHALRLQLAEQGLPQAGDVGFELMDNQAFGISQFAEQINYQRGLEGELARSMQSLGPVAQARIHLAMAKQSVFVRDNEPAKASVVLTLHPGRTLNDGQINAIVHMVSSSVPELASDAVTVVDQAGRLLSTDKGSVGNLDGTQLNYVQEVERSYQMRIERILTPILGATNIHAQVAADIDFSTREQTAERYGPNQAPNEAAIRSRQLNENYTGGDELATGVPGALTNTPPGVAPSPIDAGQNAEDEEGANAEPPANEATTPPSRLNRGDVINYEVDRSVEHVQYQRGQVERLSAAVVVNYRETVNDQGKLIREPLSDAELEQLKRLVKQAMGFSEARGDELALVNSAFAQNDTSIETLPWWQTPQAIELGMTLGRYLLVALAALFLWFMVLRPMVKRYGQPATAPSIAASNSPSAPAVALSPDDDEDGSLPAEENSRRRGRKANAYEQRLKQAREMAQEDPRLVAIVVRSWMNENE